MRKRFAAAPLVCALLLAFPIASHAQSGTWTQVATNASPGPLREYGVAFDRGNQRLLLFDGFNGNNQGLYILYNDLWELSVAGTPNWTHISISGQLPGPRHSPQWGYDEARNRVLIFGGYGSHLPGDPYAYLNDVWQLDLNGTPHWTEITPAGQAPSGRLAGAAVFDPLRQRFVGFGGTIGAPVDTWVLNLQGQANWQNVPTPGSSPNGGWGMTSVYDAAGDRMLIFGGSTSDGYYGAKNDVWELDLHSTPVWKYVVVQGTLPPARRSGAAVFDPIRNRMIIYGGFDAVPNSDQFLADAWALDFNTSPPVWSQLNPSGVLPHGRDGLPSAYDPLHDRMIVYGGWSGTDMLGDTEFLDWGASSAEAALSGSSSATPAASHVEWTVGSATGTHAAIYRQDPGGEWTARALGEVDATGHLTYDDTGVQQGQTYSYMMVVGSQRGETFGGQTSVLVPASTAVDPRGAAEFALVSVSPNPAVDLMTVTFNLPSAEPAALALFDVAGRGVLRRELGSLGPGSHRIDFAPGSVPAGLYFLNLMQAGHTVSTRIALVGH